MFEVFESIKILSLASKKEGNLISLENASALLLDQKKRKTVCLPPGGEMASWVLPLLRTDTRIFARSIKN